MFFDQKYQEVLNIGECQAHSLATDPEYLGTNFYFSLNSIYVVID